MKNLPTFSEFLLEREKRMVVYGKDTKKGSQTPTKYYAKSFAKAVNPAKPAKFFDGLRCGEIFGKQKSGVVRGN